MPAIPVVDATAASAFLQAGRLAVVGASDEKQSMGRSVYTELRDHGIDVVAVHRTATTVAGDPCHPSLDAVPGDLDGAIVMVSAPASVDVVREVAARGIPRVWLYLGASKPGAASPEAIATADELGLEVVPGACPLMFLEPTAWIHRAHRGIRRMRRSLTVSSA
jgi:predicted CoA-binding protein